MVVMPQQSNIDELLAAVMQAQAQAQQHQGRAQGYRKQPWLKSSSGMQALGAQMSREQMAKRQDSLAMEQLREALDAANGAKDLERQIAEDAARQQQMEEAATQFETSALYQQHGMSRPEAELRARGHEVPAGQKPTAAMQNAEAMGLKPGTPEFNKYMREATMGGRTSYNVTPPKDHTFIDPSNPQAGFKVIPNSPTDREMQAASAAEQQRAETKAYDATGVLNAVNRALENVSPTTAGWGGLLADVPSSNAKTLQGDLATIEANLAFDRLTKMREESKTGGALGQVSNIELGLLKSSWASLQQTQKPEDLRERLELVGQHYQNFVDALNGNIPQTYETRDIEGKGSFIKVDGQWYPL